MMSALNKNKGVEGSGLPLFGWMAFIYATSNDGVPYLVQGFYICPNNFSFI